MPPHPFLDLRCRGWTTNDVHEHWTGRLAVTPTSSASRKGKHLLTVAKADTVFDLSTVRVVSDATTLESSYTDMLLAPDASMDAKRNLSSNMTTHETRYRAPSRHVTLSLGCHIVVSHARRPVMFCTVQPTPTSRKGSAVSDCNVKKQGRYKPRSLSRSIACIHTSSSS